MLSVALLSFFFFNDTATTEIYTLSLHDALPISILVQLRRYVIASESALVACVLYIVNTRSEEHTSELQSQSNLVCRLLLEKKNKDISDLIAQTQTIPAAKPTALVLESTLIIHCF